MKCTSPNYVMIEDCGDDEKKKVHFFSPRSYKYSREFRDEVLLKGAIEVPCGKCLACRLEYSRVWANRCYLESLCHEHTWFITLTYNDENLVIGSKGLPTLEKDAITKFIKKLRNAYRDAKGIRFFGCGEYGDITMRPHYHIIVFGAPISDLSIDMPDMSKPMINGKYPIYRRKNTNGDFVYFSQTIYDCWKKGKIELEEAGWNCAAYVSRYVVKKQKGTSADVYDRLGILPEYLRMSNRPGIGAKWLLDHKEKLLQFDYLSVKNKKGVQTTRPPRYFEKLMHKDEDSIEATLMDSNKLARIVNSLKRCKESQSFKDLDSDYKDFEDNLIKKTKVLNRDIT